MSGSCPDHDFEALLTWLGASRGFDLTGYKRNNLQRLTARRMQVVGVETCQEYRQYLEAYPEEFAFLIDTILINVTSFFRDEAAWQYLAGEILPGIMKRRPSGAAIHAWSAGCASGEEPYSLAMLLCEAVSCLSGAEEAGRRIRIYATDVDEGALTQARQAGYSRDALAAVPARLRDKYFTFGNHRCTVCPELRRMVVFGRHDLAQDPPISNLDLLLCRNTLIYFTAETQRRVLGGLYTALKDGGILFLGQAERLLAHAHLFTPTHSKYRIFVRRAQSNRREPKIVQTELGIARTTDPSPSPASPPDVDDRNLPDGTRENDASPTQRFEAEGAPDDFVLQMEEDRV